MNSRNRFRGRGLSYVAAASLFAFGTPSASADPTRPRVAELGQECARKAEHGQRLRNEGKLLEARASLQGCFVGVCPALIRVACERWADEVVAATPSVIVRARDESGTSVSDVTVRVDGERVAEHLDGQAISLDPGTHRFEYSHVGSSSITDTVVIAAGEKDHALPIRFTSDAGTPPPVAIVPEDAAPSQDLPKESLSRDRPGGTAKPLNYPAWIFAGVSLTALGVFTYLGTTGLYAAHSLDVTCGSECPSSRFGDVSSRFLWADVSLGVAAVAAGASLWLFLTGREGGKRTPRTGEWSVAPNPHGAVIRWAKAF